MDKYVANIADQDMRLGEKHDTSINVDMVNLGNSDELTRLLQDAYLGGDNERMESPCPTCENSDNLALTGESMQPFRFVNGMEEAYSCCY